MSEYFTDQELACSHCGQKGFKETNLAILDEIRRECDFPFIVTSGYRCTQHPIEKQKAFIGEHAEGNAIDIGVRGEQALKLIEVALKHNIHRIGVSQKNGTRFIHLGFDKNRPTAIWSY